MKMSDKLFGIVLTLCGISLFIYSRTITALQGQQVGAGLFLLIISTGFFICGLVLTRRGIKNQSQSMNVEPGFQTPEEFRNKRVLLGFILIPVCLILYIIFSNSLGFIPTAFLLLLVLFLVFKVSPWVAVLVAIVATLFIHVVFYKVMSVPLPWGILKSVAW
jgi:putative tricarboxylic transport membrane protein